MERGVPSPVGVRYGAMHAPPQKLNTIFLKRGVLVHFERVGMEIALMLQPTVLVFSYCYKPTD